MAHLRDLRDWIALLEREGELVRVTAEVDPDLEITEIVDRMVKAGGPALLFEHPKGSEHALLINQFGTERRMCLALRRREASTTSRASSPTCSRCSRRRGSSTRCAALQKLKSIADSLPHTVRKGACQEIVLRGDDVDLGLLPIQPCWPGDPAPFITLPAVITRDPRDGTRNVGMYRMQVIDRATTFMHWQIHKDGRADWLATDGRIPVAVALGLDPITAYSASAPLPKHIDELMLAGFLRGEPVELVQVQDGRPRGARERGDRARGLRREGRAARRGPVRRPHRLLHAAEPFPVFHVTAMTMRRDAIYPSIVVGKPPQEDAWLGKATERIFLPAVRMTLPGDRRLRPARSRARSTTAASSRSARRSPGHAQKVMHALWGLGLLLADEGHRGRRRGRATCTTTRR